MTISVLSLLIAAIPVLGTLAAMHWALRQGSGHRGNKSFESRGASRDVGPCGKPDA